MRQTVAERQNVTDSDNETVRQAVAGRQNVTDSPGQEDTDRQ